MAERQLSAQERTILFQQATRQTRQTVKSVQVTSENSTVEFELPKSRLLSKLYLEIEATANVKATAGTSILKDIFSPYQIIRAISLDLNNGFKPFQIQGRDLAMYSMNRMNPDVIFPGASKRGLNYVENAASTAGTDNKIKFVVELPITLNDRDTMGLFLLQNNETNVRLVVDIDTLAKAYKPNASNGEVVTFKNMTATVQAETFTIPPHKDALPDLSILKLVNSKYDVFSGNGQSTVKLNVGTMYRKLILYFEDNAGLPILDADFNGNIELVFNTADVPYAEKPSILAATNTSRLGYALPDGMYIFDFSYQGVLNLGGSRDLVDTERLTEFWVRFSTAKAGKVTAISETLSRLR